MLPVVQSDGNPCFAHSCSQCCHDIEMILTEADLERLRAVRPEDDFWFEADDGYLQLRTSDKPGLYPGAKPCLFLGPDGRCGVHEVRPEGCRLYPAVWDEGLREVVLDEDYCPHTDEFHADQATGTALQELAARLEAERVQRQRAGP